MDNSFLMVHRDKNYLIILSLLKGKTMENKEHELIVEKEYYHEVRGDYLYIKFSDSETLESCKRETLATKALLNLYGIKKVIADNREKTSFLNTFDEFTLSTFYLRQELYLHISKVAAVFDLKEINKMMFWETAARNRFLELKIFSDIESAEMWIQSR